MVAPVVPPYSGDVPLRDSSQTNTQFSDNVNDLLTYIPPMVTDLNSALVWVNDTAEDVDDNRVLAQSAASTATTKAAEATASAASALQTPGTNATSTTTFTPAYGANSFTLAQTGKNFVIGQFVTVADSTTPSSKYFNGAITAFNSGTGAITVNARDVVGAASGSSWVITASAPSFGERFIAPVQDFVANGSVTGTVNIDMRAGLKQSLTTSGNVTFTFTTPDIFTSATETWVVLDVTKGGSHTLTFPIGTLWSDGAQPTHNSGARFEYFGTKTGTGSWIFSAARKNIA